MRTRARSLCAALGALTAGCPSTSLYRSAEPVAAGRWQLFAGAGGGVQADRVQDARTPTGSFELGARRGFGGEVDVGLKVYTVGLSTGATIRYLRRGRWSFALAPEVSIARTPENNVSTNALHLFALATLPITDRLSRTWALSFGPSIGGGVYLPATGGSAAGLWLGAFVNLEARLGERWWLVPELSAYQVVSGEVPLRGGALSLGVGLRFAL